MKLAYQAYDNLGRLISDTIEAGSPDEATDQLRGQGLYVTRIMPRDSTPKASHKPTAAPRPRRFGRKRQLKNLAMFTRQLHVLSSTGTPLVDALAALERQTRDTQWRGVLGEVKQHVESGATLSEAMAERPDSFDPVYRSLVAAGESGGQFQPMLDRLGQLVHRQLKVRTHVAGALVYPALLLVVAGVVLSLMLVFVLPRFTGLFETLDVPLPPSTQMLVAVSDVLRSYWWLLLMGGAGLGVGLHLWLGTDQGRRTVDTLLLRLPFVGNVVRGFVTARICRLLGTQLVSHVPMLDALQLTRDAAGNVHYRALIEKAEDAVTRGEPISVAFADERVISPTVHEAVRSGESTGQIGPLLLNIADFLDENNEVVIKSLASILEPVILIGLGILVGLVALSMFLPLFDLTASAGAY